MVFLFLTACGDPELLSEVSEHSSSLESSPESNYGEQIQTLFSKDEKAEEIVTSVDVKSQVVVTTEEQKIPIEDNELQQTTKGQTNCSKDERTASHEEVISSPELDKEQTKKSFWDKIMEVPINPETGEQYCSWKEYWSDKRERDMMNSK